MNSMPGTAAPTARRLLSKVPEITVWFWIIKILCTTVGESFADWINMTLGVGLMATAGLFTVVTAVVLGVQLAGRRYRPLPYWLSVVVLSITGTLYTDILTDQLGVPLWVSSAVFAGLLAVVFGVWFAKESTLSIHSITSLPRELFYWLAVLVTFALGTALGDWTLELTGWGPGASILLPLSLIAIVTLLWRQGANPVLCFWVAYILTRPLGANIGDWLGLTPAEGGLGLGTFTTSLIFLAAIAATVIYLSVSKVDVLESKRTIKEPTTSPVRQRATAGVLAVTAVATVGLLTFTNSQPHAAAAADEAAAAPTCSNGSAALSEAQASAAVKAHFPAADVQVLRSITSGIKTAVAAGDAAGASSKATELETAWDDRQDALNGADCQAWTYVDQQIDPVLKSVRAQAPDATKETAAVDALLPTLG